MSETNPPSSAAPAQDFDSNIIELAAGTNQDPAELAEFIELIRRARPLLRSPLRADDPQILSFAKQGNIEPNLLLRLIEPTGTVDTGRKHDAPAEQQRRRAKYQQHSRLGFENADPWPDAVTGAELLPLLTAAIQKYVAIDDAAALIVALWAMHCHALDAFSATPRLVIRSASGRAGKTTLLAVLSHLVPRAFDLCAGAPGAILWSLGFRPTLLIDDAPALLNASRDLRAFIRNGCRPAAARLVRFGQGYTQDIRLYAAALTVEGKPPNFLAGRCIEILLEPLATGQSVSRLNSAATEPLRQLCRKLVRWASDRSSELRRINIAEQSGGDENWMPLLLIARDSGEEWENRARAAMQKSLAQSEPPILQMLLTDIREILERRKHGEEPLPASPADLKAVRESQDRGQAPPANTRYIANRDCIRSADLARLLGEIEGQPWHEWSNGQPITTHALAKLLKPAGVRPSGTLRFHTANQNGHGPDLTDKGYKLGQFENAFAQYLPRQPAEPNAAPGL